jgi:L-fuconolactonase
MLQSDADARWILEPVAAPALDAMERAGLSFDALVRTDQLPVVSQLAAARPDLAIVIDHAAKPPIASGELQAWRSLIADCARLPRVFCKVSGLLTEAGSSRRDADLAPVVDHLMDVFGPDRLMWGSDWPLLNMAGEYSGWLQQARRLIGHDAAQAVFGRTAARFYRLEGG